jgi:hypothetical protein
MSDEDFYEFFDKKLKMICEETGIPIPQDLGEEKIEAFKTKRSKENFYKDINCLIKLLEGIRNDYWADMPLREYFYWSKSYRMFLEVFVDENIDLIERMISNIKNFLESYPESNNEFKNVEE